MFTKQALEIRIAVLDGKPHLKNAFNRATACACDCDQTLPPPCSCDCDQTLPPPCSCDCDQTLPPPCSCDCDETSARSYSDEKQQQPPKTNYAGAGTFFEIAAGEGKTLNEILSRYVQ